MDPAIFTIRPVLAVTIALMLLLFLAIVIFLIRERDLAESFEEEMKHAGGCHNKNLPYMDAKLSIETRVEDLLDRMTTKEKIGQLALVEKNSIKDVADIQEYNLGALLSGGGGNPASNTPEEWRRMVERFESSSKKNCLGIPLLYGVDAVHGHGSLPSATIFPQSIGLGAANEPDLVRRVAAATAEEMVATGVYWNFFPSLDVAKDMRWGRVYETFGSDTERITRLGQAYLEGFSSVSFSGVMPMATPKHYIATGAVQWGSSDTPGYKMDHGNAVIDEAVLRSQYLPPFRRAVEKGVWSIMAGLNRWNGEKITGSKYLLSDVLKNELKFKGFVVSDWQGASGLSYDECESFAKAINAGVDMVMLPFDYKKFMACMEDAVWRGEVSESRLDDAVRRILRAKFSMGLFDRTWMPWDFSAVGSDAHRDLAREAVRKSLVLLKNEEKILPISRNSGRIIIAGSAADNLGRQAGGWTVEWQGVDGNAISGTTIYEGIRKTVSKDTKIEYDKEGNFGAEKKPADIGIVIVGEKPYAEGVGDSEHPSLNAGDIAAIEKVRNSSRKIVVILVSGRPLDISPYAGKWDAIIAAWLPGSEGQGVADVLFGDYPFVGTLPVEWWI